MNSLTRILDHDAAHISRRVDLQELAGKNILITGASGLLGVHFLASLCKLGETRTAPLSVVAVVHSPVDPVVKALTAADFFEVRRGDLSDPAFCASLPMSDVIIHAGGYGQPDRFVADPVRTLELNKSGTLGLLQRLQPGGKFLFVSSSEIYTGLSDPPFSEKQIGAADKTHPRSCYIEGKRAGEAICQDFRLRGVQAKAVRVAMSYGPGTKPGDTRVVGMLIDKALKGKIQLIDRGEALRSLLYVGDAIERMWNVLLRGREAIYNVGGNDELSILRLAEAIARIVDVPVIPGEQAGLSGAPMRMRLDNSLYENEFRPSTPTSLEVGLERTIAWQRELHRL